MTASRQKRTAVPRVAAWTYAVLLIFGALWYPPAGTLRVVLALGVPAVLVSMAVLDGKLQGDSSRVQRVSTTLLALIGISFVFLDAVTFLSLPYPDVTTTLINSTILSVTFIWLLLRAWKNSP